MADEPTVAAAAAPDPTPAPAPEPAAAPPPAAPGAPAAAPVPGEAVIPVGTMPHRAGVFEAAASAAKVRAEQEAAHAAETAAAAQPEPPGENAPPAPGKEGEPAPATAAPAAPAAPTDHVAPAPVELTADTVVIRNGKPVRYGDVVKDIQDAYADIGRRRDALKPKEPSAPEPAAAPKTGDLDVKKLARDLTLGSEEDAAKALQTIIDARVPAQPEAAPLDEDRVVSRAVATVNASNANREAQELLARDYSDILNDDRLSDLAGREMEAIVRAEVEAGRQPPHPAEAARIAAERTRAWRDGLTGMPPAGKGPAPQGVQPSPQPAALNLRSRVEGKRNMPAPPAPASARSTPPPAIKADDPSAYVRNARKARGLPDFGG